MYYDEIKQEWIGFGCFIPKNNIRKMEIMEKEALLKSFEDLRS